MPADSLFFSFFFDDYDYLKKKKKPFSCNLASIQIILCTLGGNAALTQTVIGMLLMA